MVMAIPSSLNALIFNGQHFTQVPHDLHDEGIVAALCVSFISSSIFSLNLGDAEGKMYHHFFLKIDKNKKEI
jgi:hypothetical protein